MKRWKQWSSALLAALMLAALMAVPAGATGTGSITIRNANEGMVYTIYQILNLAAYDDTTESYTYEMVDDWKGFFNQDDVKEYINVDPNTGLITWKESRVVGGEKITNDEAEFAKLALTYARKNKITPTAAKTADATKVVMFGDLEAGYYLVDSSVGVLCGLGTVTGTPGPIEIQEKNTIPEVEKKVQENGTYSPTNDAKIGDTVNFQTTITAGKGAENYVLHDKMSDGLTFVEVTGVTLEHRSTTSSTPETVEETNYTVNTSSLSDGCTFHVEFKKDFCDKLKNGDAITIYYTAILNENAVVANDVNENETWLGFGDKHETEHSKTTTNTWEFSVFKYAGANEPLENATFTLSENNNGSDPILFVATGSVYRVATKDDTDTIGTITTNATGNFTIQGLDSGTYYLTETEAPEGYYKLDGPISVTIDDMGAVTTNAKFEEETVKIENKPVGPLPSTGGVGTTVFYVLGSVLVVGAVVLFITKKRMSLEEK